MAEKLNRAVTYLKPEIRFALDVIGDKNDHDTQAETIREMVLVGLKEHGLDEKAIKTAYLRFELRCAETGEKNPYVPSR